MRPSGTRFSVCVALVLLTITGVPRHAFADTTLIRQMEFAEKKGSLVVSTTFTELFDEGAYSALSSGFPTTVVLRVYTYLNTQDTPVDLKLVRFRSVYDLWDETYIVRIEGLGRVRNLRLSSRVEVLRTLTQLRKFAIAGLDEIDIGPYYFVALVVQLNPVDKQMLEEMRRWMRKSNRQSRLDSGANFFGSFVSVFVNTKLKGAERTLHLRSQPFYRATR